MRRFFAPALLTIAICMAGCAPTVLASLGIKPSTQAHVHLTAAKALLLAKTGLDGAVQTVDTLVVEKAVSAAQATTAVKYLDEARAVLDRAEASYHASASYDPSSAVATVSCLIAAAQISVGKPASAAGCPNPTGG